MQRPISITSLLENHEGFSLEDFAHPEELVIFKEDIAQSGIKSDEISDLAGYLRQEAKNTACSGDKMLYLLVLAANLALYFQKTETGKEEYVKTEGTRTDEFYEKVDQYYEGSYQSADTTGKLYLDYFMGYIHFECKFFNLAIRYYEQVVKQAYTLFPHAVIYTQLEEYVVQLATACLSQANATCEEADRKCICRSDAYYSAEKRYEEIVKGIEQVLNYAPNNEKDMLYGWISQANHGIARVNYGLAQYYEKRPERLYSSEPEKAISLYIKAIDAGINVLKIEAGNDERKASCLEKILDCSRGIQHIYKARRAGISEEHREFIRPCMMFMKEYLQLHPAAHMAGKLKKIIRLTEADLFSLPVKPGTNQSLLWQPSVKDKENQMAFGSREMLTDTSKQRENSGCGI